MKRVLIAGAILSTGLLSTCSYAYTFTNFNAPEDTDGQWGAFPTQTSEWTDCVAIELDGSLSGSVNLTSASMIVSNYLNGTDVTVFWGGAFEDVTGANLTERNWLGSFTATVSSVDDWSVLDMDGNPEQRLTIDLTGLPRLAANQKMTLGFAFSDVSEFLAVMNSAYTTPESRSMFYMTTSEPQWTGDYVAAINVESQPVPEPMTLIGLAGGAFWLAKRRRR